MMNWKYFDPEIIILYKWNLQRWLIYNIATDIIHSNFDGKTQNIFRFQDLNSGPNFKDFIREHMKQNQYLCNLQICC